MNELKSEYLVQYKLHSSNTSQLNLDRLTDNDIFFESKNEGNVTTYHYYTKITFKGGEQWIIEVSFSSVFCHLVDGTYYKTATAYEAGNRKYSKYQFYRKM